MVDVSAQKCGWEITSSSPAADGKLPESRHMEVKGLIRGATTVTVTKNEIFENWNQGVKYHLGIVLVGEDDTLRRRTLRLPFFQRRTRLGRLLRSLRHQSVALAIHAANGRRRMKYKQIFCLYRLDGQEI